MISAVPSIGVLWKTQNSTYLQTHNKWRQIQAHASDREASQEKRCDLSENSTESIFTLVHLLFVAGIVLPHLAEQHISQRTEMSENCVPWRNDEFLRRDRKTTCGNRISIVSLLATMYRREYCVLEHMCVRLWIVGSVSLTAFYHSVSFEPLRRVDAAPSSLTPHPYDIEIHIVK